MGQKVHPEVFRLGITTNWKSRWFNKKDYQKFLAEDVAIREFVNHKLANAGLEKVEIERSANAINIIVKASRPGLIIGRGGSGIEDLKRDIISELWKKAWKRQKVVHPDKGPRTIKIQIEEVRSPETSAPIVAQGIVAEIEKRMPFRRTMKRTIERVIQHRDLVKGIKIMISGRLDGAEMSRTEQLHEGSIPLHTLRANIDYAHASAFTTYGVVGIKVWIYKGEVFEDKTDGRKQKIESRAG